MKIKIKLSVMVIAIIAVILTVVAVILLRQASEISISLSKRAIDNLAAQRAAYWQGREDGLFRVARRWLMFLAILKMIRRSEGGTCMTV